MHIIKIKLDFKKFGLKFGIYSTTFLGESFLFFLGASWIGASGMGGGGGELWLAKELLRSRPIEWLDDSDVVRERRPDIWVKNKTKV